MLKGTLGVPEVLENLLTEGSAVRSEWVAQGFFK